jgi:hypothetical protein
VGRAENSSRCTKRQRNAARIVWIITNTSHDMNEIARGKDLNGVG